MKKITLIIILLAMVLSFSACVSEEDLKPIDETSTEAIVVDIPTGSTSIQIGEVLANNGLVKSKGVFAYQAKKRKVEDSMQAGKYELSKSMSVDEMIDKLVEGEIYINTVSVLIPEGYEFRMIVDKLSTELGLDKDKLIDIAENHDFNYKFLSDVPEDVKYRLEGYLFPATYTFNREATELEVLTAMLDKFDSVYTEESYAKAEELGMTTNQVITMASIIEREAASNEERDIIAGVFYNRLKQNMMFQSCATVQYILEERKPELLYSDLEVVSPYNTYKNMGLPPGPIASPGQLSIEAALNPVEHDYLFFVVSGNNDGKHVFSKTNAEHEAAKQEAFKKLEQSENDGE